jgi:hypothetical protein
MSALPVRRLFSGAAMSTDDTPPFGDADICLGADENPPILKMAERPDWSLFRSVEGLQQKAGVPAGSLRRLVPEGDRR